jgi:hypothetical protein
VISTPEKFAATTHAPTQPKETTMTTSTTRKLTRFQYAATLLGALAFVALAPATAHALPVNNNEGGGCHYTDKDGYDIPIDDGQSVLVDGKTVSCSGGTITVSNAVKSGAAGVRPQQVNPGLLSPVNETPKKPVLNQNVPVVTAQR